MSLSPDCSDDSPALFPYVGRKHYTVLGTTRLSALSLTACWSPGSHSQPNPFAATAVPMVQHIGQDPGAVLQLRKEVIYGLGASVNENSCDLEVCFFFVFR